MFFLAGAVAVVTGVHLPLGKYGPVKMTSDLKGVPADKFWWNGVPDKLRSREFPARQRELVAAGEPLENCGFADRYRTILVWVEKSPFGGVDAATRDCRRDVLPAHTTVHVLETVGAPVARQLEAIIQIGATAPVLGDQFDESFYSFRAVLREIVERISAVPRLRQIANGFTNSSFSWSLAAERDGIASTRCYHQSAPTLGNAIVGGVENSMLCLVAHLAQLAEKEP